jgi:8-oxo-dGTP pyrophosphatase MutT (NUDIX family)
MGILFQQFGALPWRDRGQGVEILLITSRETRRWVIPKGWPVEGLSGPESAARECFEEAGIGGQVAQRAAGTYTYDKRMKNDSLRACKVDVFPLEVMIQHLDWPERGQRELRWCRPGEAASLVAEPGLAKLIQKFGES